MTTGIFLVEKIKENSLDSVSTILNRLNPKEIILSNKLKDQFNLTDINCFTVQPDNIFNATIAEEKLKFFKVISLDAFGLFSRSVISCRIYFDLYRVNSKGPITIITKFKKMGNQQYFRN